MMCFEELELPPYLQYLLQAQTGCVLKSLNFHHTCITSRQPKQVVFWRVWTPTILALLQDSPNRLCFVEFELPPYLHYFKTAQTGCVLKSLNFHHTCITSRQPKQVVFWRVWTSTILALLQESPNRLCFVEFELPPYLHCFKTAQTGCVL